MKPMKTGLFLAAALMFMTSGMGNVSAFAEENESTRSAAGYEENAAENLAAEESQGKIQAEAAAEDTADAEDKAEETVEEATVETAEVFEIEETDAQASDVSQMTADDAAEETGDGTGEEENPEEEVKNGLIEDESGIHYYIDGQLQSGLQTITNDDQTTDVYYFDENGNAFTGGFKSIITENSKAYYYFCQDGTAFNKGYLEFPNASGNTCRMYFQEDGTALCGAYHGAIYRHKADADGNITLIPGYTKYGYYFKTNGNAFNQGFLQFTASGSTFRMYFQADGTAYTEGLKGVKVRYQANENGTISLISNNIGYYYYFQTNGNAFNKGFLQFTRSGKTCYMYFQTNGTAYTEGLKGVKIRYKVNEAGTISLLSNKTGYWYYFQNSGAAFTKGFLQFSYNENTCRMYFQQDGTAYTKGLKGVKTRYKTDTDGTISLLSNDTGYWYYFQTNGAAFTKGFLKFTYSGNTYRMLFQTNGTAYTNGLKGVKTRYQADTDGTISLMSNDTGCWYYFQSNGNTFTKGALHFNSNGKAYDYYFQEDGKALVSSYQKVTSISTVGSDGSITSATVADCAYYYNKYGFGTKQKEWVKVDGKWYYFDPDTFEMKYQSNAMYEAWLKIKNSSSGSQYYICVDYEACETMIFRGKAGSWVPYKHIICSPGAYSTPTVKGHFQVFDREYSFGTSAYTCYYATRFYGSYLFHSVLYYAGTKTIKDGRLGMHLSHGCVRMAIEDAKWIYDNIPNGTNVYIY